MSLKKANLLLKLEWVNFFFYHFRLNILNVTMLQKKFYNPVLILFPFFDKSFEFFFNAALSFYFQK